MIVVKLIWFFAAADADAAAVVASDDDADIVYHMRCNINVVKKLLVFEIEKNKS